MGKCKYFQVGKQKRINLNIKDDYPKAWKINYVHFVMNICLSETNSANQPNLTPLKQRCAL